MVDWIDNADSYRCPVCGYETGNPNNHNCKCPVCGFTADKDMLGKEYDLDRLRELEQADKEGRYVVLKFAPSYHWCGRKGRETMAEYIERETALNKERNSSWRGMRL